MTKQRLKFKFQKKQFMKVCNQNYIITDKLLSTAFQWFIIWWSHMIKYGLFVSNVFPKLCFKQFHAMAWILSKLFWAPWTQGILPGNQEILSCTPKTLPGPWHPENTPSHPENTNWLQEKGFKHQGNTTLNPQNIRWHVQNTLWLPKILPAHVKNHG